MINVSAATLAATEYHLQDLQVDNRLDKWFYSLWRTLTRRHRERRTDEKQADRGIATAILVLGGLYAWTREVAIAPLQAARPPPGSSLRNGARIVALGDCMVCHTAKGGAPMPAGCR